MVTANTCVDVETRRSSGEVFGRLLVATLASFLAVRVTMAVPLPSRSTGSGRLREGAKYYETRPQMEKEPPGQPRRVGQRLRKIGKSRIATGPISIGRDTIQLDNPVLHLVRRAGRTSTAVEEPSLKKDLPNNVVGGHIGLCLNEPTETIDMQPRTPWAKRETIGRFPDTEQIEMAASDMTHVAVTVDQVFDPRMVELDPGG